MPASILIAVERMGWMDGIFGEIDVGGGDFS